MASLRVAILGAGAMARRHLDAYRKLGDVEVVAVAARTNRARDTFLAAGVPEFSTDSAALLSRGGFDAVSVVTPTGAHAACVKSALEAGCHVLCEKPLGHSLAESRELVAAAERADRRLMTGFVMRFFPELRDVKRRIDAGEVGDVSSAWFRKGTPAPEAAWYRDPDQSGGVLFELGIHGIDLVRWWLGRPIERVSAVRRADDWWLLLEASGGVASVGASWGGALGTDSGVVGSKGSIVPARDLGPGDPFHDQIAHFVDCIRSGARPAWDGRNALANLAVAEAAEEAARSGRAVRPAEVAS